MIITMAHNACMLQSQEYFEQRSLKKGSVGWVLLVGLGVAYVISGDFSGWNYGMANGGWLGLAITFAVMGIMYACMSYALMNLSHILLRKNAPNMERGYRTPGGVVTTGIAFVLSCIAIISSFFVDMVAACTVLGVYIVGLIYFRAHARKRIVGNAPEEEFAALNAAEAELR